MFLSGYSPYTQETEIVGGVEVFTDIRDVIYHGVERHDLCLIARGPQLQRKLSYMAAKFPDDDICDSDCD
jgi:hypothetical protein